MISTHFSMMCLEKTLMTLPSLSMGGGLVRELQSLLALSAKVSLRRVSVVGPTYVFRGLALIIA